MAAADYDVVVIGSGAAGGMAALEPNAQGREGPYSRSRRFLRPGELLVPRQALGGAGTPQARRARPGFRIPCRCERARTRPPRAKASCCGESGASEERQIYGDVSRYGTARLELLGASDRRMGNPLARAVQRHRSVLRQRGEADRRLWGG